MEKLLPSMKLEEKRGNIFKNINVEIAIGANLKFLKKSREIKSEPSTKSKPTWISLVHDKKVEFTTFGNSTRVLKKAIRGKWLPFLTCNKNYSRQVGFSP